MAKLRCEIRPTKIDLDIARASFDVPRNCGGYVSFEGIIRDTNNMKQVDYLEYEVFETLAVKEMNRLASETCERFALTVVHAIHRSGRLEIGDVAIIIQVAGGHRSECFLGCKYMIDEIKTRVPIWKHEFYMDGSNDWTKCTHT